jgi:hypothetical protein
MPEVKHKFHWVHLLGVVILVGYFVLSKLNTVNAVTRQDIFLSFIQLYIFGAIFACIFLYLFSHEKFFPVAKDIEKVEEKKEKKYLKRYLHHGKILATFIIGTLGGPVFSSLTARLLLSKMGMGKYFIVILANIPSTLFTVGITNGFIKIFGF